MIESARQAMKRIAIIGGGPAGLMAAIAALEEGPGRGRGSRAAPATPEVVVFDRGIPLATLLRTGGGRCNLANATFDNRRLAASYPRGSRFLLSAFARFGAHQTMEWFQDHGLALAVEEDGRVFPASQRASEVRDLLLAEARGLGVRLRSRCQVTGLTHHRGSFQLAVRRVHEEEPEPLDAGPDRPSGRTRVTLASLVGIPPRAVSPEPSPTPGERFDAVILATGGDSADPEDSGYRLARGFGHSVTPLVSSLTALATTERWPANLAGLTLRDARVVARLGSRTVADERGSLLFTHRGISGPLAFRISSHAAFLRYGAAAPLQLQVSLYPEGDEATLERRVDEALARHPRRTVAAAMRGVVPRSMVPIVLEQAGVPGGRRTVQATREERRALARALLGIGLSVVGAEAEGEIVTAGGIELHLVEQKTMESRIVPGLFFCGELLDIDGFTGGYNLQAAWTTGRLAGLGARQRLAGGG